MVPASARVTRPVSTHPPAYRELCQTLAVTQPPSDISFDWHDDAPQARMRGEIDAKIVENVDASELRQKAGGRELTVDMTGVTFIDSTGIGLLLKLRAASGGLRIVGASRNTRRLFSLAGLDTMFTYC